MQIIDDVTFEKSELECHRSRRYRAVVKRVYDISFSVFALVTMAPLMGVIAAAITVQTKGQILYAHERVGRHGKRFKCLKFRTMVLDADKKLNDILANDPAANDEFQTTGKLRNDPRILQGLGSFLRKSSLDELPQFLNVLLGDMSVVGPRPVTDTELVRYGTADKAYLSVRPGITGPWQVSGRSDVSFSQRIVLDQVYAQNWSNRSDVKYVLATVSVVLFGKGAY